MVADIADRIVVMRQGEIVEQGPTAQILGDPQQEYTQKLIAAVPPLKPKPAARVSGAELITIRDLSKTYGGRRGLFAARTPAFTVSDRISMTIREGEIYGLVGESGSGKSTLGRMIVGLADPDSGEIRCGDQPVSRAAFLASKTLRRSIQMVFQDPYSSFNPRMKIGPALIAGSVAGGESRADAMRRARELVELVQLDQSALDRFPHEFSGGQRQRLGIARALMMQPRLLVADEAVSALDVSVQEQVIRLLLDIKARIGLSILFITHDLRVAGQICDRIGVLRKGVLVEENTAERILTEPTHDYTRMLLDSVPGRSWR
ncbi:ABC transporter ATP-binding protein [Pseudogemmobacter humi]|uniref:Glutathione import ATP-binding protein GsiA n=1 Tax=Pseudogemmobacter humi TaxID=2483812 RepID=A0A3P5WFN8_9RHOB|nr:Glutathione import ATP-binding protein GsiA [Pseudogemmobacter humi]